MARRRSEPVWLSRRVVDAIHADQIREHGGLQGIRDENGLEAALARPRQKWHFGSVTDIPALADAYGFAIVNGHPYRDGNKRIGFLSAVAFLGVNGFHFEATDAEVVAEFIALAAGEVDEPELARWIRSHATKAR